METYVILSRLTDEGAEKIQSQPDRIKTVDAELDAMGVHVKAQYALLGAYDFLTIVEAPDQKAVMRAATEIASRGSVRVQTMPAVPIDKFITMFDEKRLVAAHS